MVAGLAMQIATRLRRWARLETFDDQAVRVPDRRIATVGDGARALPTVLIVEHSIRLTSSLVLKGTRTSFRPLPFDIAARITGRDAHAPVLTHPFYLAGSSHGVEH